MCFIETSSHVNTTLCKHHVALAPRKRHATRGAPYSPCRGSGSCVSELFAGLPRLLRWCGRPTCWCKHSVPGTAWRSGRSAVWRATRRPDTAPSDRRSGGKKPRVLTWVRTGRCRTSDHLREDVKDGSVTFLLHVLRLNVEAFYCWKKDRNKSTIHRLDK